MTSDVANIVTLEETDDGIALLTLDAPGTSANVLTVDLFAELDQIFADLLPRADLKGLVLYSAKRSIFVAGADLKRIADTLDWPDERIVQFCEDGRAVMRKLSQMPFPTVAAIHGACVGGGLELTLWCDYRIASSDRKTRLGLPEVNLGLVPGWAGTVRLPRIADYERAVELIATAQSVSANDAAEIGFVDHVVAQNDLLSTANHLILGVQKSEIQQRRERVLGPVTKQFNPAIIGERVAAQIEANRDRIYPAAPRIVLEHMLASASLDHDAACDGESLAMAKVYGSGPSYGLINHFFLSDHNRKHPGVVVGDADPRELNRIGIVGAGLMGTSIAEICLKQGCSVVMTDASADAISRATGTLQGAANGDSLTTTTDYSDFSDCDLVIESVVEVADIKRSVLSHIESAVSDRTLIATNTSAIPLEQLSTKLIRPENFCGVHFCHPQLMQLVEVVAAENSSAQTVNSATSWIRRLRKLPVVVRDHAGFVVNRLLAAMLDQSLRLQSMGYSLEQIDDSMRCFGFRGGPFEIVDVIGADVCVLAGREMLQGGVDCVTVSPVLPRMVKLGWLGRKKGAGFYQYDDAGQRNTHADAERELGSYVVAEDSLNFEGDQIAESICSVMVLEAARILEQQIVASHKDIDICVIHGFAFPAHVGGILFWADRVGLGHVNDMLHRLSELDSKLAPTELMVEQEKNGGTFY